MNDDSGNNGNGAEPQTIDPKRRRLLGVAGAGALAATLGGVLAVTATSGRHEAQPARKLRWGFVGTGGIANSMAPRVQQAENAELVAVSSRKMETAKIFADKHGLDNTFDSWADMIAWDGVDAIYVATPTSVREEICVAAANGGKHVLGEKPFANLPSLRRITSACRDNGVGFMDGTHFPHHPRTAHIKASMQKKVGWPWSVASAFQFGLSDTTNIRLIPELEPYGAIGDAGWYNMRAAVEYTAADVEIASVDAYLRRHSETGAVVSCSGVIVFSDGSTTTWNCGFESGAGIQDLRISGATGVVKLDDFLSQRRGDNFGVYEYRTGWGDKELVEIPSAKPGSTLMFEDFATMAGNQELIEASMHASERTQQWLDAVWNRALATEGGGEA
jgi:predicted dehydrogenase